jgi:VanZ family protein
MKRVLIWAPTATYMILIFWESSLSNPAPAVTGLIWDKALHTAGYALLGGCCAYSFRGEGQSWRASLILGTLLASVYGATDEFHQSFTPKRTADITDWVADSLGAFVGATAYMIAMVSTASRPPHRFQR